jgi:hypothetical protein
MGVAVYEWLQMQEPDLYRDRILNACQDARKASV